MSRSLAGLAGMHGTIPLSYHPATPMKLSLIFPAHNEADTITNVLSGFAEYFQAQRIDHEIIVINDGSKDLTSQKVRTFASDHPFIRLIEHQANQGYGAALRSGFSAATGDYIFFSDSDGQFRPGDLGRTWPLAHPKTIILGYRQPRAEGVLRQINAKLWGWWISKKLGFRVRDLNCAWKLFPRSLVVDTPLVSNGAFISAELLYYAKKKQLTFHEVAVHHRLRTAGRSSGANPLVIFRAFRELLFFSNRYKKKEV